MAHLYNLQIDVQDTSRSGTYHNTKFKKTAEQHGLEVKKTDTYGWSKTCLNQEAKDCISNMQDKDFTLHRKSFPALERNGKSKQSTRKYICPVCGCIIRATKEVNVVCGDCDCLFIEDE